jgi:hypothetical protein
MVALIHPRSAAIASVLLMLIVVLASCGLIPTLGDPTRTVTVRNTFSEPVDLYTLERKPNYRVRLAAGQSFSQGWMFPISADDRRVRRVEADTLQGDHVFCLDVTYEVLVRRNWTIEVSPGHPRCDV